MINNMVGWLRKDLEKSKEKVAQLLREIKVMDDKLYVLERIANGSKDKEGGNGDPLGQEARGIPEEARG
ncbi:MAG: hypothetical protein ACXABY_37020 [Candidatus Thorarchaeota archaeon]|jgi:hypothetical protein